MGSKKLFSLAMAAVLLCAGLPQDMAYAAQEAEAQGMEVGSVGVGEARGQTDVGFEYQELTDGTLEITKYTGTETELEIPGEIAGKRVTSMGCHEKRFNFVLANDLSRDCTAHAGHGNQVSTPVSIAFDNKTGKVVGGNDCVLALYPKGTFFMEVE